DGIEGKIWKELSEGSSGFPGRIHLHLNAVHVSLSLEIQAKLGLRPFQAQIRQSEADSGFAARGKYELALSSPKQQGMSRLARDPLPHREEERQAQVDGRHAHGEDGQQDSKDIHRRACQLNEWRQSRAWETCQDLERNGP